MNNDNEKKIIVIEDILNFRKRKEIELKFYTERLGELKGNINLIQKEINLTNEIIKMIEKERVIEIKPKYIK